ncbi:MAG: M23 family metallopeptidase [Sphingomonas sp.]|jgi:murein DD-endopeptidase MepM/ murein hydrolase activator NlpD
MTKILPTSIADAICRVRDSFKTRHVFLHDGRDLRRFSMGGRAQLAIVAIAGVTLSFSAYGAAHVAANAVAMSNVLGAPVSAEARVAQLQGKIESMRADVAAIKQAAVVQAARVEQRQAMISAVLEGKAANGSLALNTPLLDPKAASLAADVIAPLRRVEAQQVALAAKAQRFTEQRYAMTAGAVRRLGITPERLTARVGGVGGPYEPVAAGEGVSEANADAQFRSLFMTWKKLDSLQQGVVAIPSAQPVSNVNFSSMYGVRSDPFRGTPAMHPGVDIPGQYGTPIYATADGMISRAERAGGYGNMVEIDHGLGIATRYGHLSKILVAANTRVKRGQLIALMGSTGRSTGNHLHYEVRIDGHSVNPIPFLQTGDYLLAVQDRALKARKGGVGGPAAD